MPDGRVLWTLYDAGRYATALPKAVQQRVEWQTAAEMPFLAAQGQRPHHVRRHRMRQALHAHKPGTVKPRGRKKAKAYNIVR